MRKDPEKRISLSDRTEDKVSPICRKINNLYYSNEVREVYCNLASSNYIGLRH